jgi:hypothetical protein
MHACEILSIYFELFLCPGYPSDKPFLSVYAIWNKTECRGKMVRQICVFGVGDLPTLVSRPELFANKFYSDYEPLALDCLEAWLRYKETRDDRKRFINLDDYRRLLAPLSLTFPRNTIERPLPDYEMEDKGRSKGVGKRKRRDRTRKKRG